MPKYFLSKQQHLHDRAKWGLHEIGRRLVGGRPIDPAEHALHVAAHAEADNTPLRYLCGVCGETFEPKPWPDQDHLLLGVHTAVFPGGRRIDAGLAPDGASQREIPIAICAGCCQKTRLIQDVEHDWDAHDHLAKPLTK